MKIQKFFQLGNCTKNNCDKIIINRDGIETYNNNKIETVASINLSDYIHIEGKNISVYDNDYTLLEKIKYITIKNDIITFIKISNNMLEISNIYNLKCDSNFTLKEVV